MNLKDEHYPKELVESLLEKNNKALDLLNSKHTNHITDLVREEVSKLNKEEQEKISKRLNHLLLQCYDIEKKKETYDSEAKFLIKENLIYYIGRLGNEESKKIISNCYYNETNNMNKMNLAFAACLLGNQEIELDFISQITPGSKYDVMIRSWTMAFFNNVENPYTYIDQDDDWEKAKKPRIERLQINEQSNKKYKKAMDFRLFDLTVLYMFCKNRSFEDITEKEYEIIEKSSTVSQYFTKEKEEKVKEAKMKLLSKK